MIHSVRIEASGDSAGDVQRLLHDAVGRIGLGVGEIADEHYDRDGLGYRGRIKVNYQVPMTAVDEAAWNRETVEVLKMAGDRTAGDGGMIGVIYHPGEPIPFVPPRPLTTDPVIVHT